MTTAKAGVVEVDRAKLPELLAAYAGAELLARLGLPSYDPAQPALTALHAGAAFHRLAVLREVAESYRRQARLREAELPFLRLLDDCAGPLPPRAMAEQFYRISLAWDDRLAEAWYGLARLLQHRRERDGALDAFTRAASLAAHARASGNAHLRANAHFARACLLEDMARDDEALLAYRQALAGLDHFGVHHRRIADFLRRRGLIGDAVREYEKLMVYGHRYFPEFTLPPLRPEPAPPAAADRLEVLYETSDGAAVVFWHGSYYRIDPALMPMTARELARRHGGRPGLLGRLRSVLRRGLGRGRPGEAGADPAEASGIRKADNMIALEPAGEGGGDGTR